MPPFASTLPSDQDYWNRFITRYSPMNLPSVNFGLRGKQPLSYLRLADKRLGLLVNFNAPLIKDGIARFVNGLHQESLAKSPRRQESP